MKLFNQQKGRRLDGCVTVITFYICNSYFLLHTNLISFYTCSTFLELMKTLVGCEYCYTVVEILIVFNRVLMENRGPR